MKFTRKLMTGISALAICMSCTAVPVSAAESYQDVLTTILNTQKYGDIVFETMEGFDTDGNSFAVCDVDGDGQKELLVNWSNTFVAGQQEVIFSKDASGNIVQKGTVSISTKYYDNGVLASQWSHNQTLSEFYPYTLEKYNSSTGKYEIVGSVVAWDKEIASVNEEGNAFPDSADVSKTGRVYYILTPDNWELYSGTPLDVTDYEAWLQQYTGSASAVIQPQYWTMTANYISPVCKLQETAGSVQTQALGDHNHDGSTDAADAACILQYAAEVGAGLFSGTLPEFMQADKG